MLQLQVVIAGRSVTALVDLGSAHSFISDDLTSSLDLWVEPCLGLSVKVANGDRVPSVGVCPDTAVDIHGEVFNIDCYVLPLGWFDVVVGVHWLHNLGPVVWDFEALTMDF